MDSSLGEPLLAKLSLITAPGERIDASCVTVAPKPIGGDDLPRLSRARFALEAANRRQQLRISTTTPINDPVLMLGLRVGCGFELTREYTLLLAPSGTATAPPVAQVSTESGGSRRSPQPYATGQWRVVKGETLQSIGAALYPHDRKLQRRFRRAVVEANPDLFHGEPRPDTAPLAAGTILAMPDLRRLAARTERPPMRKDVAVADPVAPDRRSARPRPTQAQQQSADRLSIGGRPGGDHDLRLSPELDLSRSRLMNDAERDLLRQEQRLLATLEERTVTELTLAEKIRRMEETLAALQASLKDIDRQLPREAAVSPPAARGPAIAPAVAVPSASTQAMSTEPVKPSWSTLPDWSIFAVMGAMVFGLLLLLRGRGRRASEPVYEPVALREGAAAEEPDLPFDVEEPAPRKVPERVPTTAVPAMAEQQVIDMAEHESALELAEIMLSFGRVQGAAQTLADYIESNPKQAVRPWLKLLEVYRDADMRAEFETLAWRLNQTFNVEVMPWQGDGRRSYAESLESYPHIIARLVSEWGSQECLDYLNHLIRDNRSGARSGFPLSVLHEIMLLVSVLESQRPPRREGAPG